MSEEKNKWINLDMKGWFFIVGIGILWFINSRNIDPLEPILILSIAFIAFPLVLLGIFAVPSIRKSIKKYYENKRRDILKDINKIRKEQEKIKNIDKLIEMDEEIIEIRKELLAVKDNRFEKNTMWVLIVFSIVIFSIYLDFGQYIDTKNSIFVTFFFIIGVYYLSCMIRDLFIVFER